MPCLEQIEEGDKNMDGEHGEESDLQLLHPLSVSPPNVTFMHVLFLWPLGSGGLVSVGCNQFGCWIISLFLGFLTLLFCQLCCYHLMLICQASCSHNMLCQVNVGIP